MSRFTPMGTYSGPQEQLAPLPPGNYAPGGGYGMPAGVPLNYGGAPVPAGTGYHAAGAPMFTPPRPVAPAGAPAGQQAGAQGYFLPF